MRIDLASLDKCPDRPSPFGPTRKVVRGSDHGRAKLNEVAVQKMRDMSDELGTPVKVLAGVFGVAPSTVYAILSGDRWSHTWECSKD
tara:strand:+ start:349 stop:609 length:261 start_codon:yes stop_codon:yes gene_type:complete